MKLVRIFSILALILAFTPVRADEPQTITVAIPRADTLAIQIPPKWTQTLFPNGDGLAPGVKIVAPSKTVSLQLAFVPDLEGHLENRENVDRMVTTANQRYIAGSVEERQNLKQLVSELGHGSYASFTDGSLTGVTTLKPNQFRIVTSGFLIIKRQAVAFALLSNDTENEEFQQALKIVTAGISVQ